MFEAKLSQNGLLRRIVESIKDMVNNVNFECDSDGITLKSVDQSHVAVVCLSLKAEGFDYFHCEKPITLGVKLSSLYTMLKCASNDDSVTISCKNPKKVLSFLFESRSSDRVSEFELKLIDVAPQDLNVPTQEYAAMVYLTASEYKKIFCDMSTIGEMIQIEVLDTGIKFESEGDIGKGSVIVLRSDEEDKKPSPVKRGIISMFFTVKHLIMFAKATPLCKRVILRMSKGMPLLLEFKIGSNGYVRYYLAPRIIDEEL
ncbi:proliferating cell nuclear antigen (nucleomorph) [Cryptomonas paramecium]|uniref:DNA sliding clamp PCNA n=1 Tax=Cryptomonas paramaecium TaxID=2898 RepID=F2HIG9_9CRYP|nr:proliferating cell nuclear antigen [Cryptomonas paramecium]AEA39093.1 proliferating cell nuclear antigen [Cryptomonas paramecium]|mmetsp:Transcript_37352/g.99441  ORF Transcript_37352/g.99441 Transcript_37352/m.99441 type:complete len:258 (-) Transcript_37352:515-1288(-)